MNIVKSVPAYLNLLSESLGLQSFSAGVSQLPKDRDRERILTKGAVPGKVLYVLTAPNGGRCEYSDFTHDFRAQRLSDLSKFP